MDGKFTIEEGNLIAIYVGDTPDRKTAVDGIESIMSLIDDADIFEIAHQAVEKMNSMSDSEFLKEYIEPVLH